MSFLLGYLHQIVDTALSFTKLLQNRQVGWLTIDRPTGEFKREQQPLWKKLKLLLLFNPLTEWIDRTHLFRLYTHEKNFVARGLRMALFYLRFKVTDNMQRKRKQLLNHTNK